MSRRDAGAAASQGARHARDRLQSTLGSRPHGLLLTDDGQEIFEYDGGTDVPAQETGVHGAGSGRHPTMDSGAGSVAGMGPAGIGGAARTGPALRWRLGVRVAVLICMAALLAGAWFWWQVSQGQPHVIPLSDVSATGSPSATPGGVTDEPPEGDVPAGPGDGDPSAGILIVHVAGAVASPGVVQLPSGSRVHEALAAAGGSTPAADLDRLNLAAPLVDGQKVYVPLPGEPLPSDSSGTAAGPSAGGAGAGGDAGGPGGTTNLNTAGIEELDALPKVGPVLAQRIVDWRKEHGPFKTVEELDAVDGVGPKMLETLLPLVSV
ncbi:ComEA family DNA-binding protein [Arthrobacter sp. D1-29]